VPRFVVGASPSECLIRAQKLWRPKGHILKARREVCRDYSSFAVIGEGSGERIDAIPGLNRFAIERPSYVEELETTSESKLKEQITTFPQQIAGAGDIAENECDGGRVP
jgi:hypothetical protein